MEMVAIFDFRALTMVHKNYNFKTASSNAVKSCTLIEDIQMKKRTEALVLLSLHNTFLIIFCVKNTKNSTFQILLNKKKIRMFKEISFCTFLEYYSIMIHQKFH